MKIDWVISRYNKNVDWVNKAKHINKIYIYDKENPTNPNNIPVNKGNEASVYLKFIIDNYDNLSDYIFFTHDDEYTWHHSGSIIDRYNEALMEAFNGKTYFNVNNKCVLGSIKSNPWYDEILLWYNTYIEKYIPLSSLPESDWTVGHRGSAQFLVHKSAILSLPIEFYNDLYQWIITTDLENAKSGRFLEWTWHLFWDIFPNL
jgi:hypothetical protein